MSLNKDTWSVVASFLTDVKDIITFESTSKLHRDAGYMGVTYIECKELWNTYTSSQYPIPQPYWVINDRLNNIKQWHISINKSYNHYYKHINIPPKKWIFHHINLIKIDYPIFLNSHKYQPFKSMNEILKKLPKLRKVQFHGCPFSQELLKILFMLKPLLEDCDISFFGDTKYYFYYSRIRLNDTLILKTIVSNDFINYIPKTITIIIYHTYHTDSLTVNLLNTLVLSRKVKLVMYNNVGLNSFLLLLNYHQAIELYIYACSHLMKYEIEEIKQIASIRKVVIITNEKISLNSPNITILEDNKYNRNIYGYVVN